MNYYFFMINLLFSLLLHGQLQAAEYQIQTDLPFNKVIVWGHKLHTHTHSYVHGAFERAFKALGYQTYWLDNNDRIDHLDLSSAIFITEGQVDQKMPLRDDCFYILHNCNRAKYAHLFAKKRCVALQVYRHDFITKELEKVAPCTYLDHQSATVYMPWATDLLPHEIDEMKKLVDFRAIKKAKSVCWVGTYDSKTACENSSAIDPFKKMAVQHGIGFESHGPTSLGVEANRSVINRAYMAPALQGPLQRKIGYIPCRIFKNISYGSLGITNSKAVYDLFEGKIVYNDDTAQLFLDAQKRLESFTHNDELFALMDFVKDKHTYLNRIQLLLGFLQEQFYRK